MSGEVRVNMYSVQDTKAEFYLPPFYARTDFEAQRMFQDSVKRDGTILHDHPEDFCLFLVGTFNQDTGEIEILNKKSLGVGSDFLMKEY